MQTFEGLAYRLRIANPGRHPALHLASRSGAPQVDVTLNSASNAHAVSSPVPVGCTNPCRANIPCSSGLVDTGIPHAQAGCANANSRCNPHARSADTGGGYWARNTSFGYANSLAINNGTRGHGGETKAQSQH
jgi:hypothetical protein